MDVGELAQKLKDRMLSPDLPPWLKKLSGLTLNLARDIERTNIFGHAGGMAYTTLFSIVPFLAVTFATISAFEPLADPQAAWFDTFQDFVLANLAPDTGKQVVSYIATFLENLNITKIGITGTVGLFVTVIFLLRNIEMALNEIWMVKTPRSIFRRFILFWTFCTLGALVLTMSLGVIARFDLLSYIRRGDDENALSNAAVSAIGTFIFFAFVYKVGPNVRVTMKAALAGAVVSTLLIRVGSSIFTVYAVSNQFYESIYGAVAVLPLFLLWLYISWAITLFGALISWRTQHGFVVGTELDEARKAGGRAPQDLERNAQVRSLMPLACILAVNRAFVERRRRGVSGHAIACELDLPINWVIEGLRVAASMGYIVMSAAPDANIDEAPDVASSEYFPTLPPSDVGLRRLLLELTEPTLTWLDGREPQIPLDLTRIATALRRLLTDPEYELTLAELLLATNDDKDRLTPRLPRAAPPSPEMHH